MFLLLKDPCTDLLGLTPSELQHQGSSLKATRSTQGGNELSGIRVRTEGQLSPRQKCWQRPSKRPLSDESSTYRADWWAQYRSLHEPESHSLPHPDDLLRPTQAVFVAFPYQRMSWLTASHFPKTSETSIIRPQQALYISLSGPKSGTSSSRPSFTA